MASAAEQLARNLSFSTFSKAKALQQRIWFTLGALLIYRLGTFIPVPGIDPDAFRATFEQSQQGIIGMFNMFSGGAVERMAIFALNLIPYITASIVVQVVATASPRLEALKKEGEAGRRKMNQYTRYLAVLFCAVQAYGLAVGLEGSQGVVLNPGWFFRISTVITLVGGTMFLMWLGEQMTSRGVGNGISLIIFAGIVANLPSTIAQTLELSRTGALPAFAGIGMLLLALVVIAIIVFFERAQRRLLIQYPKRQVGNKLFQGDTSHLPLKLNTAGVIPVIFGSSLLLLPTTIASFAAQGDAPGWLTTVTALLGRGQPLYMALFAFLIIFFAFFYTAIVFNPTETADNLKRSGGFIPGIRPGERTAAHIDYVLTRITVAGALYLTFVALLPEVFFSQLAVSQFIGGTSLLIMVTVTLDTVTQIQSHLVAQQYEGLLKKSRLGGKRR
ncbi:MULTISPECIES: preprotein translocase subunit SecY [unclassified Devosia]|uniref:preprotein translocase subunit SecY n=1 Tax=unclassified Devosia TaxID=196773 RepID=UPI00145E60FE|nr:MULTISPECIES: preprotein translocase subunit SecY [unclassified Devosia]MBJ6985987.1 preprotein translocase subunit SecY [Devosia sp. MC521]MBJ7578989.1 preprotein translocase subunit SecY [Devosia sp. MC532]MBK1793472.1 preprotein translocase subunit SecY [Devosia sp. WQ 349K1]QMW61358.1 preprotein translocase subunit SecY [Devosia sp. MC521]